MINVSDIVNDPDFAESFSLLRSTVTFVSGGLSNAVVTVPMYGVVEVAKEKDLRTLPEGDEVTGAMSFHTSSPIYMTNLDAGSEGGLSDIVLWHNQQYRIVKVFTWEDFGYYKTIGVRMSGA